jgi:hypothetical protein
MAGARALPRQNEEISMKLDSLKTNRDFWAGVLLIVIGGAALIIARDYPFGTTRHMGPGYFPIVLGTILILFGITITAKGLRSNEQFKGKWPLRPLIVLSIATILFGAAMKYAGLIPALLVLVFGSAAAGRQFRLVEVLLLTVGLTVFSVVLFVWALDLQFSLIGTF